ncbi:MAG: TetR family transcriptional regulator [Candidatus Methanomethylophilus sp.]|nr:TetR family transcriptional regulator [Methanomethylophilus sp.]
MKDMADDKKELLIKSAVELLKEQAGSCNVTTRELAARSGVNSALINYYFGSKDSLLKVAVNRILEEAGETLDSGSPSADPRDFLFEFILKMGRLMLQYEAYTRIVIPNLILKDPIELPQRLLPAVRAAAGGHDETACRMISYQLVTFLQVLFYRMDDVSGYLGFDLRAAGTIEQVIRSEINLLIPEA